MHSPKLSGKTNSDNPSESINQLTKWRQGEQLYFLWILRNKWPINVGQREGRTQPRARTITMGSNKKSDQGHTTSTCYNLKDFIERQLKAGMLLDFVADKTQQGLIAKPVTPTNNNAKAQNRDYIGTIPGGPTLAGDSN
ncbi:hypothetical protein Pint_15888 [Pistacia integerrima]|uniref:Uncharacterized protein n=1 Tax=Pistacia integerrima TaxID=434235 RepID=A0ACC0ZCL9_9ROSI|nr:hypothetical protein Pint_15888 [Pistacia integerrima]